MLTRSILFSAGAQRVYKVWRWITILYIGFHACLLCCWFVLAATVIIGLQPYFDKMKHQKKAAPKGDLQEISRKYHN